MNIKPLTLNDTPRALSVDLEVLNEINDHAMKLGTRINQKLTYTQKQQLLTLWGLQAVLARMDIESPIEFSEETLSE